MIGEELLAVGVVGHDGPIFVGLVVEHVEAGGSAFLVLGQGGFYAFLPHAGGTKKLDASDNWRVDAY